MKRFANILVLIKGAGDLATGVAARLHRCGFPVVMTELPRPLMVRRTVSFGEAVYEGRVTVEGIEARAAGNVTAAREAITQGIVPILVDPDGASRSELAPLVVVDAIMDKRNTGTRITDAPLVVALGPGFEAGIDCHAVIETNRGHWLGRVLWSGSAQPDTGTPGAMVGRDQERVLRAPADGILEAKATIGDIVAAGELVACVDGLEIRAGCGGVLRGLIRPGTWVQTGLKIGDVDPRAERSHCFAISDKSLAIAGGVLEAILAAPQLVEA